MSRIPPHKRLTDYDKEFIRKNSATMYRKAIAAELNHSEDRIDRFIKEENLPVKLKRQPWDANRQIAKQFVPQTPAAPIERRPYRPGEPPYQFYKPMYI